MKLKNSDFDQIAEQWSGAYRADYNGREVSIQIIKALFEENFNLEDAKVIYFSKLLRWFFDSNNDNVSARKAKQLFKDYLKKETPFIKAMFINECNKPLVKSGEGWIAT